MIEFKHLRKSFGSCVAVEEVSFQVKKNSIHSIVGENGAGKSTLLKMLCGLYPPDRGEMLIDGQSYQPQSAQEAFAKKIVMIHQHFMLGTQLTALENIFLSQTSLNSVYQTTDRHGLRLQIQTLLNDLKWHIDLDLPIEKLSVGDQQRIEIVKAILTKPEVIVFDEPTAVLTPLETDELLQFILKLKQQGLTILLVTHKLNEVIKVSDQVSVLRRGRFVKTFLKNEIQVEAIAEAMVGHHIKPLNRTEANSVNTILETTFSQKTIQFKKGEIFGVAGVEGNGQAQLIQNVLTALKINKISYGDITEDRLHQGCFPHLSLLDHVVLKGPPQFQNNLLIKKNEALDLTEALIKKWDVRPPLAQQTLGTLSGGNQQKFVVGLEMSKNPHFLIAAHPTRGVDLGAISFIHQELQNFAALGGTVLLISSELDEVLKLSHRYGILFSHQLQGPFATDELNDQQIGQLMTGTKDGARL